MPDAPIPPRPAAKPRPTRDRRSFDVDLGADNLFDRVLDEAQARNLTPDAFVRDVVARAVPPKPAR